MKSAMPYGSTEFEWIVSIKQANWKYITPFYDIIEIPLKVSTFFVKYFFHKNFLLRLVSVNKPSNPLVGADIMSFGTRSGSRSGVELHIFRVETQRDLAFWSRALVLGSHGAALVTKQVSCGSYISFLIFV